MMTINGRTASISLAGMLFGVSLVAHAQGSRLATLTGQVRDSAGHAVPAVEIRLRGTSAITITNDSGGFRLSGLTPGAATVAVRRLGFLPTSVELKLRPGESDSLVIALTPVAVTLAGIRVQDGPDPRALITRAGFWDRRSNGFGHFVTRAEILSSAPHDFVDVVRMMPGLQAVHRDGRPVLQFGRNLGVGRPCPPQYFVDGMRIENGSPDEFLPDDVEGVELYAGPASTPPQFAPRFNSHTCGAIVIWTRTPGE
jgi:hypothetical protein